VPWPQVVRKTCLILAATLAMIVVLASVDSGLLYMYVLNARRLA
jgi:preprotein translocase subunit SecE